MGACGVWMTAGARVLKRKRVTYSINRFDADCVGTDPVITRVSIGPKYPRPGVTLVNKEEFYR